MDISDQAIITASKENISGDLSEDEMVILNMKNGVYYGLNEVGLRVWRLVQEPKTFQEIREILLREYEVDKELCSKELTTLIQDLDQQGLVEIHDGTNP